MIEFSIVGIVAIFFIGLVFDLGFGFYQYSLLNYAVSRASRGVVLDQEINRYARSSACFGGLIVGDEDAFDHHIAQAARETVRGEFGDQLDTLHFSGRIELDEEGTASGAHSNKIVVTGKAEMKCFLTCNFLPNSIELSASSKAILPVKCEENSSGDDDDGGMHTFS